MPLADNWFVCFSPISLSHLDACCDMHEYRSKALEEEVTLDAAAWDRVSIGGLATPWVPGETLEAAIVRELSRLPAEQRPNQGALDAALKVASGSSCRGVEHMALERGRPGGSVDQERLQDASRQDDPRDADLARRAADLEKREAELIADAEKRAQIAAELERRAAELDKREYEVSQREAEATERGSGTPWTPRLAERGYARGAATRPAFARPEPAAGDFDKNKVPFGQRKNSAPAEDAASSGGTRPRAHVGHPVLAELEEQLRACLHLPLEERKKIVRERMVEFHPDKNREDYAKEAFQFINSSRSWLLHDDMAVFTVVIDKSGGRQLGINADLEESQVVLKSIATIGLISEWNLTHPESQVCVGDIVTEVNNLRGGVQLMEALKGAQHLSITVQRPVHKGK